MFRTNSASSSSTQRFGAARINCEIAASTDASVCLNLLTLKLKRINFEFSEHYRANNKIIAYTSFLFIFTASYSNLW